MDYIRRVIDITMYNTEEEHVPFVEPYAFTEGGIAGETVRTIMQRGIEGIFQLKNILINKAKISIYDCANSIMYELMTEARKILETCDDDSYGRYLHALFELFDAMPLRNGYCDRFIREYYEEENYQHESTFDFIYNDEPTDHYVVLNKIIADIEKYPVFAYQTEFYARINIPQNGTCGVFPGMCVSVVKKEDQITGKLTRGIVAEVLTKTDSHPHGIKVRLENGAIGRVHAILN